MLTMDLVGGGIVGIIVLAVVFFIWSAFWLWWQSILSNAPVSLLQIIFMRFRKVNPGIIVTARISAKKAGIDLSADELEAHYLAGGQLVRVVQSLIAAHKADIPLSYDRACAIDLAGRDIKEAVDTSVNPKVIDVPSGQTGRPTIDVIGGDGKKGVVNIGCIRGGHPWRASRLPERTDVCLDVRVPPTMPMAQARREVRSLVHELRDRYPDWGIDYEIYVSAPGAEIRREHEMIQVFPELLFTARDRASSNRLLQYGQIFRADGGPLNKSVAGAKIGVGFRLQ